MNRPCLSVASTRPVCRLRPLQSRRKYYRDSDVSYFPLLRPASSRADSKSTSHFETALFQGAPPVPTSPGFWRRGKLRAHFIASKSSRNVDLSLLDDEVSAHTSALTTGQPHLPACIQSFPPLVFQRAPYSPFNHRLSPCPSYPYITSRKDFHLVRLSGHSVRVGRLSADIVPVQGRGYRPKSPYRHTRH